MDIAMATYMGRGVVPPRTLRLQGPNRVAASQTVCQVSGRGNLLVHTHTECDARMRE